VASDVAFLAMDLDYWGLEELTGYGIERFTQLSGDSGLAVMLNFYKCYRAYVRGKIGLFTANDPAVDEAVRQQNLTAAGKYFQLALQYATR
jgi:aminoglycoside phosphotransferase family enzyme